MNVRLDHLKFIGQRGGIHAPTLSVSQIERRNQMSDSNPLRALLDLQDLLDKTKKEAVISNEKKMNDDLTKGFRKVQIAVFIAAISPFIGFVVALGYLRMVQYFIHLPDYIR